MGDRLNVVRVLVTNDDGIFAPGLWVLARKLKEIASVIVAAPDREQSATGTAVTLSGPIRVQKITPPIGDVTTFSVEGTPSDSVILAIEKLVKEPIDFVVSGINNGPNVGDDVFISGTVGAAMQGYFRGISAVATSAPSLNETNLENAAEITALLLKALYEDHKTCVFLNINVPEKKPEEIKGVRLADLAHKTHIDTVREGYDGKREYYWLVRQKLKTNTAENTDISALEDGCISVSALHTILFQEELALTGQWCAKVYAEFVEHTHQPKNTLSASASQPQSSLPTNTTRGQ